jgi:alpha-L-arabinofuranosidase
LEFNRNPMGRHVRGSIEAGRWYDIKVELAGSRIRCFLNGELIHDEVVPSQQRFFASAGRDEATGEMVLKAINTSSEPMVARLKWGGLVKPGARAECTVLASPKLTDNNSMEEPTRVVPVVRKITLAESQEFAPCSLTVLRVPATQ